MKGFGTFFAVVLDVRVISCFVVSGRNMARQTLGVYETIVRLRNHYEKTPCSIRSKSASTSQKSASVCVISSGVLSPKISRGVWSQRRPRFSSPSIWTSLASNRTTRSAYSWLGTGFTLSLSESAKVQTEKLKPRSAFDPTTLKRLPGFHRIDKQFYCVAVTRFKTTQRGFTLEVRVRRSKPDQGVAEVAPKNSLKALRQLN